MRRRREQTFTAEQIREVEARIARELSDAYEQGRRQGFDAAMGTEPAAFYPCDLRSPLWDSSTKMFRNGWCDGQAKLGADLDKRCSERGKK